MKKAFYIVGGLALIFTLFGTSLFAFEGLRDANYDQMLPGLLDAIIEDRKAIFLNNNIHFTHLLSVEKLQAHLLHEFDLSMNKALD